MAKSAKEILAEYQSNLPKLQKMIPGVAKAFGGSLMPEALKEGALSTKTKELIVLGIAVAATCDYCIALHVKKCFEVGATKEEIAEACGVAILMAGGPAFTYSTFVLQAIEDLGMPD